MYTGAGTSTIRDIKTEGKRPILYVINWEKSQLDYTLEKGASQGRLEKVTGTLYRDGKPAANFSADTGYMDEKKSEFKVEGNVHAVGIDPKSTLDCQRMEFKVGEKLGQKKITLVKAFGKVTLGLNSSKDPSGKPQMTGTIGPVDELWCMPDLKTAGTPGFFQP